MFFSLQQCIVQLLQQDLKRKKIYSLMCFCKNESSVDCVGSVRVRESSDVFLFRPNLTFGLIILRHYEISFVVQASIDISFFLDRFLIFERYCVYFLRLIFGFLSFQNYFYKFCQFLVIPTQGFE